MRRYPDWRSRLARAVAERRATPHVWGRSDCGLTISDLVCAMTGEDVAADMRGYSSRFGALRSIRRTGACGVIDYLDARLPRARRARAGDWVVELSGDALAPSLLADGRGGAWGQGAAGLVRVPMPRRILIWSV